VLADAVGIGRLSLGRAGIVEDAKQLRRQTGVVINKKVVAHAQAAANGAHQLVAEAGQRGHVVEDRTTEPGQFRKQVTSVKRVPARTSFSGSSSPK